MDINSDLGESYGAWRMGDDAAMLDIVTSANVACGFHAGDPAGILDTLKAAAERGVAVGAHVAYPDLVGFGRRHMDPSSRELVADVVYQIGALRGLARAAGTQVRYVKPHGALYNTIAHDERQAKAVIAAVRAVDPTLVLVALAGAPLVQWARDAWGELKAFSTGGNYVNFLTDDEPPERVRAALGPAVQRLAQVKRRWDPDNVFRTNRNVAPA